jgi:hypothetical protein
MIIPIMAAYHYEIGREWGRHGAIRPGGKVAAMETRL